MKGRNPTPWTMPLNRNRLRPGSDPAGDPKDFSTVSVMVTPIRLVIAGSGHYSRNGGTFEYNLLKNNL
jgi:hypothetical protein